MAKTKKHEEIQQEKASVREQIAKVNGLITQAAGKVPDRVRNGSHQTAVAWKDLAMKVMASPLGLGSKRASLRSLNVTLAKRNKTLAALQ